MSITLCRAGVSILVGINHKKVGTTRILEFIDAANIKVCAEQFIRIADSIVAIATDIQLGWSDLDTGEEEIGKDYFVYACLPASGDTPVFKISLNSTYPQGYNSTNSRKIGGFHNNPDGDILQYSIWDLDFHPSCPDPRGMVYCFGINRWVDIYLPSDDGAGGVQSVFGGTILDTLSHYDFVDRGAKVGKRLTRYDEFQVYADGSPIEVNIEGSADPVATGGHTATDASRIVSTIGVEDCVGVIYQWGMGMNHAAQGFDHTHTENQDPEYTQNANTNTPTLTPAFSYYALPSGKGQIYQQGAKGLIEPVFGGKWDVGVNCGPLCQNLFYAPYQSDAGISARFVCAAIQR
ncbi:MAG: hypothetical protein AB1847_11235 [bacterium]